MDLGEATRLYQCALEEQRIIRSVADEGYDPDVLHALEGIDAEVARAYYDMDFAHMQLRARAYLGEAG